MLSIFKAQQISKENQNLLQRICELEEEVKKWYGISHRLTEDNNKLLQKANTADKWEYEANKWRAQCIELKEVIEEINQKEIERKERSIAFSEKKKLEELELEYQKSFEYKLELIKNSNIAYKDNLMGKQEFMIYRELIFCENIKDKFIVFPQVSLKSFIKNETDDEVWKTYSNLIADFLFVLKDFKGKATKPFAVLEFNGSGHYGLNNPSDDEIERVKERDLIKQDVIVKAGLRICTMSGDAICQKDNPRYIDEILLKERVKEVAKILEQWLNAED